MPRKPLYSEWGDGSLVLAGTSGPQGMNSPYVPRTIPPEAHCQANRGINLLTTFEIIKGGSASGEVAHYCRADGSPSAESPKPTLVS